MPGCPAEVLRFVEGFVALAQDAVGHALGVEDVQGVQGPLHELVVP